MNLETQTKRINMERPIDIALESLKDDDRKQFIRDNQEAFKYGATQEFGMQDDHLDEDGEIISREAIESSIDAEGAETYRIICDARMKRKALTITRLLSMLVEDSTATGSASAQPMTVPRIDILMVSARGPMTLLKKSHLGWKSLTKRSRSLSKRSTMTARVKSVALREQKTARARKNRINGSRLRRRSVECPLASVMTWGLKILSNQVSLMTEVFS